MKAITRRRYFLAASLFVAVSGVLADDFKTVNGKRYKNATVSRVEPDGILIKFSGGIVKIPDPTVCDGGMFGGTYSGILHFTP
jgi:hypothetical protein